MKHLLRRLFLRGLQFTLDPCPACGSRVQLFDKPLGSWATECRCGASWSFGPDQSASAMLHAWTCFVEAGAKRRAVLREKADTYDDLRVIAGKLDCIVHMGSQAQALAETDLEGDIDRDLRAIGADRIQQYRVRTDD